MTHTHDRHADAPAPARLPEFSSTASPEERADAWAALIRDGDTVPEEQLDRALFKLLEEIRRSL